MSTSKISRESNSTPLKFHRPRNIKFTYIWQASIPDSWNRIFHSKNIQKLHLDYKSRNTLDFLGETQKYITKICPPLKPEEVEITPSSVKFRRSSKRLRTFLARSKETPRKLNPISIMKIKKKSISPQPFDSQIIVKSSKSITPVFKSLEYPEKQAKNSRKHIIVDLKLIN